MNAGKRFLIFSQYFPPEIGASQSRLAALARELRALGHCVEIVTALPHHLKGKVFPGYRGRFYVRESWEGLTIHRTWLFASSSGAVVPRLLSYFSYAATGLVGLLRAQRPDYLFVESPPIFLILPAVAFGALKNVPIILNVADLWPESVKMLGVIKNRALLALAESLERFAYRQSRYISAATKGICEGLRRRSAALESKLLFLPNGVDVNQFYPRPPDVELVARFGLEGKRVFLYAGTHGLAYRLDLLLEAAQRLRNRNIVFLFVGDGYSKEALVKRATKEEISNVIFVESQPESEMPRFFSLACGSIIPLARNPLFEGTRPAKMFPSLASGVPIVYAGAGEGSRLVIESGGGLVVPPESVDDINRAILTLSDDLPLHRRMAESGRQYATSQFSWQKIVADWLSQLRERELHWGIQW